MKRNMALGVSLAIVLCVPAYAGHCRQQQVVIATQSAVFIPQGFIAVPYAVPVALPSYVHYQAMPQVPAPPVVGEPVQATSAATQGQEAPPTLVSQSCVKCHSGPTPKGKLDLSGELSPETRLKMIQRMLADDPTKRMPKGKLLEAQAIGLLIQELSRAPTVPKPVAEVPK